MSQVVEIELPDELPAALHREAAEVAGLSRATFIAELGRFGVSPFQETADEIMAATQNPPK